MKNICKSNKESNKTKWYKISKNNLLKIVVLTCLFLGLIFFTLGDKNYTPIGIAFITLSMFCIMSKNLDIDNYKETESFFKYKVKNYEIGLNGWKFILIVVLFLTFILISYFYAGLIKEFEKNYSSIFLMIPLTMFIALVYIFIKQRIYVSEVL